VFIMADGRTADDSTRDDAKGCSCGKGLAARVAKALHDNPTAIPGDLSHLVGHIRDGGEALQFLRGLAAGQDSGGPGGGSATGRELGVQFQDAGSSPCYANSPAVRTYSADRLARQCNGGGSLNTGGRRR
jgi:hypothetical protein